MHEQNDHLKNKMNDEYSFPFAAGRVRSRREIDKPTGASGAGIMNARENLVSLYRRQGYESAPLGLHLCPALEAEFARRHPEARGDYLAFFGAPYRIVYDPGFVWNFDEVWRIPGRGVRKGPEAKGGDAESPVRFQRYYPDGFTYAVRYDGWGVAHEENPNAHHMTRMYHPLTRASSVREIEAYPWPDFEGLDFSYLKPKVEEIHSQGLAVFVWAECTVWETAWYLRGMENLFVDMVGDREMAERLLDVVTDLACYRVRKFAAAGADILGLGDDIGMQSAPLMSPDMYRGWLKPRLARVIAAAKAVAPDILISYHSCGYVEPFIDDLIEIGVDILNPVQPECMSFEALHKTYGHKLSFSGTIGTQQMMPYGTPGQIREEVRRNLAAAGPAGGLFCTPTHMLAPEVPWENVEAYVEAVRNYRVK